MPDQMVDREKNNLSHDIMRLTLFFLFFCSGCSALMYQVAWQRMLFSLFGTDIESVTMIVSVFMFGLGIGGLCGGVLSDVMRTRLLTLYVVIEFGIAIFGFLSPDIIYSLDAIGGSYSQWVVAMAAFIALAFPTVLMGATFPLLVTHVSRYYRNIGESVGALYFSNTLGGALGAYFAGFLLLNYIDLINTIYFAATINFMIAIIAYLVFKEKQ